MKNIALLLVFLVLAFAAKLHAQTTVNATFSSATSVPITATSYTATGNTINFSLNYAPTPGTTLTVINNTGLAFIQGTFSDLAQGQAITLTYNGNNYNFVANYYGDTGNDLVLQWANTVAMGWGLGANGQMGNGSTNGGNYVPTAITTSGVLSGKTVVAMSGGVFHGLALCSDGTVAAWGDNTYGQLGNGSTTQSNVPVAVTLSGALSGKTVVAVTGGDYYSLALCSDGTVFAWGSNSNGQLGNNSTTNSSVPVAVTT